MRFLPIASFLVTVALTASARAECEPPQNAGHEALPPAWRAAVDALVRSAAEPGHPWSCAGGKVALEVAPGGAVLHVARSGEAPITRTVAEPEDVVPLGQALLAAPLVPPPPPPLPSPVPPPSPPVFAPAEARDRVVVPPRREPRLLLGGGLDTRAVGGSGVASTGLAVQAAVPMGRWLPALSLRQQSAIFTRGPSIDEISVAIGVQYRVPLQHLEFRAGLALRGGVVIRDLPRPQGEQGQVQGRLGGVTALAIPVLRVASFLVWADGDVVALSRETTSPATARASNTTPKSFPTFTLGGGIGVEVAL